MFALQSVQQLPETRGLVQEHTRLANKTQYNFVQGLGKSYFGKSGRSAQWIRWTWYLLNPGISSSRGKREQTWDWRCLLHCHTQGSSNWEDWTFQVYLQCKTSENIWPSSKLRISGVSKSSNVVLFRRKSQRMVQKDPDQPHLTQVQTNIFKVITRSLEMQVATL